MLLGASIKLGLGDFVFYSVLVSRAATYGFSAFVACFLVILGVSGRTVATWDISYILPTCVYRILTYFINYFVPHI